MEVLLVAPESLALDNWPMQVSRWQKRIERARELVRQYPAAAEMLEFYIHVAGFQEDLELRLRTALPYLSVLSIDAGLSQDELKRLNPEFDTFLSLTEEHGPIELARVSRELRERDRGLRYELLSAAWSNQTASRPEDFLALQFLQPQAEWLRSRAQLRLDRYRYSFCPFCKRKPGLGVLRPMGDGASRSMVCSFCLAEWEFRRIVCPGCGEENDRKLSLFTASDFDYIRIEACETCKTYIKTVDLTKNGHAEPIVDEIASAALDLWATDRGYVKLQKNILGL